MNLHASTQAYLTCFVAWRCYNRPASGHEKKQVTGTISALNVCFASRPQSLSRKYVRLELHESSSREVGRRKAGTFFHWIFCSFWLFCYRARAVRKPFV